MTGAELVVAALRQQGIETVFGYPGGAIMPIYDALYDGGVEHILCRHEQGAAIHAIGIAAQHKTLRFVWQLPDQEPPTLLLVLPMPFSIPFL